MTENIANKLYLDGIELREAIPDLDLTPEFNANTISDIILQFTPPPELSLEMDLSSNPFVLWKLIGGHTITNNFLKMHGGVIQRNYHLERLRKLKEKGERV